MAAEFVVPGRPGSGREGPGPVGAMGTPIMTQPGGGTPFTEEAPGPSPAPAVASKIATKDGSVTLDVQVGSWAV